MEMNWNKEQKLHRGFLKLTIILQDAGSSVELSTSEATTVVAANTLKAVLTLKYVFRTCHNLFTAVYVT